MTRAVTIFAVALIFLLGNAGHAQAYVGPGVGLTFVSSFIGLCLALLAAIWAVISWPVRRLLRRWREKRTASEIKRDKNS